MRWEDIKRFQYIEALLLWEGRLTARHLADYFSVSRPTAQKFISEYKQLNPDAFAEHHNEKGQVAAEHFSPQFINEHFATYEALLRQSDTPISTPVETLPNFQRNICPTLVRPILLAIRNQLRLDIGYLSISSPDFEDRIIQPHSLVYDGVRYHVRAYCEKNGGYRDFVLSRFSGEFAFEGGAQYTKEQDELWNTFLEVVICPDHRLDDKQKRCIEYDYQMVNGTKAIETRAALLKYVLHALRVDIYQPLAEQQQIVIEPNCLKKLSRYL